MNIKLASIEIENNEQKIVFDYHEDLQGYGYTLFVIDGNNQWKPISNSRNPLIRGKSFDLYPQTISRTTNADEYKVSGIKGGVLTHKGVCDYPWSGTISIFPSTDWFKVEVEVNSEEDLTLQMVDGFEPEIMIDMGSLPPYDRGDHVWYKTNINNPTKWNDEAYGNDLPALYYYDSYHQFEVMMFFNMTPMSWMSRENIARFLNYRCGFRRSYKPTPQYELGLFADGFSGKLFPKGKQVFEYYLKIRKRVKATTEQLALTDLLNHCLELVPAKAEWPPKATDWQDFTEHCAENLLSPQCWNNNSVYEDFILNYVNGYSPAWQEAFEAKSLTIDFKAIPCMDSAAFISFPLTIVNQIKDNPHYQQLLERILKFMRQQVRNNYTRHEPLGTSGTWQYVYILEQIWQVAHLNQEQEMLNYVIQEVETILIPLAHNVDYLFPLSFDFKTLRKYANGDAYAISGLYAYFMLRLHSVTKKQHYLEEAKKGVRILHQLPINSLAQEVFMLGLGIQAASELYEKTAETDYQNIYEYLLAQNLRMMYWYNDNTKEEYRDYHIFGMFQACTPIIYPAFFENVECLARIASTLDKHPVHKGLLRVFNQARINNFYLFPECLPENRHMSDLMYIPFENLGVLEDEKTGWIGQEIYGAGQVFEAYLMWEAFAKSSDRDVLLLNLNNYKFAELDAIADAELTFIVYNPENIDKTIQIQVNADSNCTQAYWGETFDSIITPLSMKDKQINVVIEADQSLYLKLTK
ncbi:hypothetical protein EHS13_27195 [Paenibacillus psychroresistens]|uniref:Uncharacterized protein n=1 Tax=Paenibacillus psychroresistens TaxID=1778678 RepID=A0A6B8RSX8_9BACL|nr:hypothetical protein [Paenibacillus psychroresistens]QGQ98308.1 hypothetical protein EHS13_27195 [Paenibacillus psychroresistens]